MVGVIQSKTKRKIRLPDPDALELQENIAFAEELTRTVIVQMIHTIGENKINVGNKDFIRDVGLLIEFVKGSILNKKQLAKQRKQTQELYINQN